MAQSGLILPSRAPGGTASWSVLPRFVAAADLYWRDQGLAFGVDYSRDRRDLVTGTLPTATSAIGGYTALGPGLQADATRTGLLYATPPGLPAPFGQCTFVLVVNPSNSTTGTRLYLMTTGSLSNDPDWSITLDTSTNAFGITENSVEWAANGSAVYGQTVVLIAVKNGVSHTLYIDGAVGLSTSGGQTTRPGNATLGIGRQAPSTSNHASGTIAAAMAFNRALSQNEAVDLTWRLRRAISDTERFQSRYFASGGVGPTFQPAWAGCSTSSYGNAA